MKNFIKLIAILFSLQTLTSCAYKIIEGGGLSGVRVRQVLESNESIIFGRIKVYDKSDNLSPFEAMDIVNSCVMFINDDPLYIRSLFRKYNRPQNGQSSNIYKGLFAIQIKEKDFHDGKELNLACGTDHSRRKLAGIGFAPSMMSPRSYLKMDLKRQINVDSFEGEAIYLGDVTVYIPKNAKITKEKIPFKVTLVINAVGGSQSRGAIKKKIEANSVIKNNFKETSRDLIELFPYIEKDFSLKKSILD